MGAPRPRAEFELRAAELRDFANPASSIRLAFADVFPVVWIGSSTGSLDAYRTVTDRAAIRANKGT